MPEFLAAWVPAGPAMSAVLYQPAFTGLTRRYGPRRVTALTILTLVAGLASTVYAPITAALVSTLSWQQTYVVLAVVLAVITLPGHVFGLGLPWTPAERQPHRSRAPDAVARSGAFIVLAAAMSLAAFAVYAAVVNLIPLLHQPGLTTGGAAVALGLGGVGQVLGRLGYGPPHRRDGRPDPYRRRPGRRGSDHHPARPAPGPGTTDRPRRRLARRSRRVGLPRRTVRKGR